MPSKANKKLLKEITERFEYATKQWRQTREESKKDRRYVAGDPWDPKDKQARIDAGRPVIVADQLGQFVNMICNDVRQNKRSGKVVPKGNGANDQTAELRGGIIRNIEYESRAQSAYISAFENAITGSYGYFGFTTKYESPTSFNQSIRVRRFANPDAVLGDPDCKEADWSDMGYCFVIDRMSREEFKRKYPDATVQDFDSDAYQDPVTTTWGDEHTVQVAEYWKVKITKRTLLQVETPEGILALYEDEIEDRKKLKVIDERESQSREVIQYITNGVEILEENEWAGDWIPVVPVLGKEMWVDFGSGPMRILMSLVRLARDPYMLYCYYRTTQTEITGQIPKALRVGYEGQFEGHEQEWQSAAHQPKAFLQVKAKTAATGDALLPLPQVSQWDPGGLQVLDGAAEAARRDIQAAMGLSPLPVSAQRQNEKSGVALQRIEAQSERGSFHFIDNYDRALEHGYRIMNNLLDKIYDAARDVGIRKPDETYKAIRINEPVRNEKTGAEETNPIVNEQGEPAGEHDVTVSTGPSYDSQREQANAFVDLLVQNVEALPVPPEIKAELMALSIRLKDLGPLGDEMAKIISPQNADIPPQAMQAINQAKQQAMHLNAYAAQLEQVVQKLQAEKAGKVTDNEAKLAMTQLNNAVKLAIAEITTKAQETQTRMQMEMETWQALHQSAHDVALQAHDQAHQQDMQQQQQDAATQSQQQDQQFQAQQAEQQPEQPAQ